MLPGSKYECDEKKIRIDRIQLFTTAMRVEEEQQTRLLS